MRRLREKLAQANLKLGRNYPEPKLSYTQRGTSAGTNWHICWYGNISGA